MPSSACKKKFICYAAGIRWGFDLTLPLAGALSLTLVLLTAVKGEIHWMRVVAWLGLTAGTFAGGAGLAFLGDRNKQFASQIDFFSRINATMQVDQGLAESLRLFLEELATTFRSEEHTSELQSQSNLVCRLLLEKKKKKKIMKV